MRILFTACPTPAHIYPMLPLARAAYEAGHLVRLATGPAALAVARRHGITGEVAGPSWATIQNSASSRYGVHQDAGDAQHDRLIGRALFGDPAEERLTDLRAIADDFRPHLVVHDVLEFAGHLLARELGVPAVAHGIAPIYPAAADSLFTGALEATPRGSCPSTLADYLETPYLDIGVPSLSPARPMQWQRTIPLRADPGLGRIAALPSRAPALPHPRSIHVTLAGAGSETALVGQVVQALRDLPVNLIVVTGRGVGPDTLGEQPDHVVISDDLPHGSVPSVSDLLITDGGAIELLAALRLGVPQVVLPRGRAESWNAEGLTRAGAGLTVDAFSASALRHAVRRALTDPQILRAVDGMRSEMERRPSPGRIMALLEDFAFGVDVRRVAAGGPAAGAGRT